MFLALLSVTAFCSFLRESFARERTQGKTEHYPKKYKFGLRDGKHISIAPWDWRRMSKEERGVSKSDSVYLIKSLSMKTMNQRQRHEI
jgi:hypothetical protein